MTPEEYVMQQCIAFKKICEELNYSRLWEDKVEEIPFLDEVRDLAKARLWPDGTPEELGDSVAIMWGAMLSRMIAGTYVSRWGVDPETKTPIVILKCGSRALQLKALLVGAQAFNSGGSFADIRNEVEEFLGKEGAEKN